MGMVGGCIVRSSGPSLLNHLGVGARSSGSSARVQALGKRRGRSRQFTHEAPCCVGTCGE